MSEVPVYPEKAWTLLVFMAGDNDMEEFGDLDLVEMESLPSDEHLHVVAQFDSRSTKTYRYRVLPGRSELAGEPLGEVNTGDPASLTRFVTWGKEHFPARRTALIIWNHGTGLRELPKDFDYSTLRSADSRSVETELQRSLFAPSLEKLAVTGQRRRRRLRGIAIDATDRDYLDNQELQAALAAVPPDDPDHPGPRVDLIGFDACLMNAVEIAYQLRGLARFMVGSQENEPGIGWPYAEIVTRLHAEPDMDAGALAGAIVPLYAAATRMRKPAESPYTQSALDLARVESTYGLVTALAQKMLDEDAIKNSKVRDGLRRARQEVKRFRDRDLADLRDWCDFVRRRVKGEAGNGFRDELLALQEHLEAGKGLVVANEAHGGRDEDRIHGVSIYWPQQKYAPSYDKLDFAASGWGRLVQEVLART